MSTTAEGPVDPRTVQRTFIVADLVGYSALTDTHGDALAADLALSFMAHVRRALGPDAQLVKMLGDGALIATPDDAGALSLLDRLLASLAASNYELALRVGVHAGTAITIEGPDYLGGSVNVTARLAHEARPGEVVATNRVAETARRRGDRVTALGSRSLRHIGAPIDVYEIELASIPLAAPLDPVCHMRLDGIRAEHSILWAGRRIAFCSQNCVSRFRNNPGAYVDHLDDC